MQPLAAQAFAMFQLHACMTSLTTIFQLHGGMNFSVHKTCAWHGDNHVDENLILLHSVVLRTLPKSWAI